MARRQLELSNEVAAELAGAQDSILRTRLRGARFELRNSPSPRADEAEPVLVSRSGTDPNAVFLVAPPTKTGSLGNVIVSAHSLYDKYWLKREIHKFYYSTEMKR